MTTTPNEQPKIYKDSGGDRQVLESGGELRVNSGGKISAAGTQPTIAAITDGSTGTANDATGVGSISDSATKNAVATLVAKVNALTAALKGVGIAV